MIARDRKMVYKGVVDGSGQVLDYVYIDNISSVLYIIGVALAVVIRKRIWPAKIVSCNSH